MRREVLKLMNVIFLATGGTILLKIVFGWTILVGSIWGIFVINIKSALQLNLSKSSVVQSHSQFRTI